MKGRKRGKTMLATSTPELKRLRRARRQVKKHSKIQASGSAACKKTLFEAKHAGNEKLVPPASKKLETKKNGEDTKKKCSKTLHTVKYFLTTTVNRRTV